MTDDLEQRLRAAANRHSLAHLELARVEGDRRALVLEAIAEGWTLRRIAASVGVSHQRVAQIADASDA